MLSRQTSATTRCGSAGPGAAALIKAHGSLQARELAAWLGAHLHGADLVERERYLVVPGDDLETLSDRCASLEALLRRIGLPLERTGATDELRSVLGAFLTPRPRQFGPAVVDVSASGHLVVDGEYVRAFDLGKLPPTIVTDGPLSCWTGIYRWTCRSTSSHWTWRGQSSSSTRAETHWSRLHPRQDDR